MNYIDVSVSHIETWACLRHTFDPNGSDRALVEDVRSRGVVNPITVSRMTDGYMLVDGFRRVMAAQHTGKTLVPAYILNK